MSPVGGKFNKGGLYMVGIKKALHFVKLALTTPGLPPVMLWGPSGIGKSTIIKQIATEELDLQLIDLRVSLLEPVDLRGVPAIADNKTVWKTPVFLPTTGKGILFLDEINLGSKEVLHSLYQLVLDRKLGEYRLPDGWKIICAGNRQSDKAGVTQIPDPLIRRLLHIEIEARLEDFTEYAVTRDIDSRVISYVLWSGKLIEPPDALQRPTCNPRSWEWVSNLIKHHKEVNTELIAGLIGSGTALEFTEYVKVSEAVQPKELINNISKFKALERSLQYAAIVGICNASEVETRAKVKFFSHTDIPSELSVLGMRILYAKEGGKLLKIQEFSSWVTNHGDVLL
jgi:hypothetical protein